MMHNGEHHGDAPDGETGDSGIYTGVDWTIPGSPAGPFVAPAAVDGPVPQPPPAPFTTILNNGPTGNRVDIVIVGDGYTSSQLTTYATHARNVANNIFNEAPLSTYAGLFNIHRVDVTSPQSGVDADPTPDILRTTALDMHFNCGGTDRLLCVDTNKAQSYAVNAPQVDHIIALANSTKYGGAGYGGIGVLTASGGNSSSLEIVRHEFGHSFAGLADEYGGAGTYAGPEPSEQNVSILTEAQMAAQRTKWYRWLDLPQVGTFLGGYYNDFGVYRPTSDSKMRSLGQPWGAVNTEQLIFALYRKIRPIDNATPSGTYPADADFFVDTIDPRGHSLTVQWQIDGVNIPGATGLSFDTGTLDLSAGNHTLTVRVVDPTTMVRNEGMRSSLMTQQRSWTIVQEQVGTVEGRFVFYNNSAFDGRDPDPGAADDDAVAADKEALLAEAGGVLPAADFSNYTSYSKGVNGVMVDVEDTASMLTSADFSFKAGTGGDPAGWATVPEASIFVRPGDGEGNSDRYTVIFPDGSVRNQWLQVTVKATAASALEADDVFYFGNLVGDAGAGAGNEVGALDVLETRRNVGRDADADSHFDHNRDGRIDPFDVVFCRRNLGIALGTIGAPAAVMASVAPVPVAAPPPGDAQIYGVTALLLASSRPPLGRESEAVAAAL